MQNVFMWDRLPAAVRLWSMTNGYRDSKGDTPREAKDNLKIHAASECDDAISEGPVEGRWMD